MKRRVLAHLYCWYGTPWGPSKKWMGQGLGGEAGHNPELILNGRRDIGAPFYPMDGIYDSCDESTVRRQIMEAEEAGLDGFILAGYGKRGRDIDPIDVIMGLAPEDYITITDIPLGDIKITENFIIEMIQKYCERKQWIKMDDRPVFFSFRATRRYSIDDWKKIKEDLKKKGYNPFIIGDPVNLEYLEVLDGLYDYNPMDYTLMGKDVKEVYKEFSDKIHKAGKMFVATVMPGFDNRQLHLPGTYIPRENGHYYRIMWEAALNSEPDWVQVTSWNELGEGTGIEPTREFGKDYIKMTRQYADFFVRGLYGEALFKSYYKWPPPRR